MPNISEVTAGKPKIGGHVYRAPIGTALPEDATTALGEAYVDMGYISEDGVTNTTELETQSIKDWGGSIVLIIQTSKEDKFKAKFISALNPEVQKMVYGDDNVLGTAADETGGLVVKVNSKELQQYVYVFEMVATGNIAHRVVIPCGKPVEIGDITYKSDEAVGYEVTLGCAAYNSDGDTQINYWGTN